MVKITFEAADGGRFEVDAEVGLSLMEAARANAVPGIDADCGGCMACGTCHVMIAPQWHARLPSQSAIEKEILDYVPEPHPNTRLSCQIPITEALDGIVLQLPARQR